MKSLVSFLLALVALESAAVLNGYAIDATSGLAILFAAGIATLFVDDYSRAGRRSLERSRSLAAETERRPAGKEFASVIIFNTTVA